MPSRRKSAVNSSQNRRALAVAVGFALVVAIAVPSTILATGALSPSTAHAASVTGPGASVASTETTPSTQTTCPVPPSMVTTPPAISDVPTCYPHLVKFPASKNVAYRGVVTIETFGYSFGHAPIAGTRFHADVRNVNAGNFPSTKNGLMSSVRKRVMANARAKRWLKVMRTKWLPKVQSGQVFAIGCSRGHHRSVTLAWEFAQKLRAKGFDVQLVNRDITKVW